MQALLQERPRDKTAIVGLLRRRVWTGGLRTRIFQYPEPDKFESDVRESLTRDSRTSDVCDGRRACLTNGIGGVFCSHDLSLSTLVR